MLFRSHLEKIEIKRFRGIKEYTIDNFKGWTSITGPNSTGKSSIISGISFLGSNSMPDVSDIPSGFKPTDGDPLKVPIEITYFFRLNKKFNELISDSRIVETLIQMYDLELLKDPSQNNEKGLDKIGIDININKKEALASQIGRAHV